jgi:hypothetical protein
MRILVPVSVRNIDSHICISREMFHRIVVVAVEETVIYSLPRERKLNNDIVSFWRDDNAIRELWNYLQQYP